MCIRDSYNPKPNSLGQTDYLSFKPWLDISYKPSSTKLSPWTKSEKAYYESLKDKRDRYIYLVKRSNLKCTMIDIPEDAIARVDNKGKLTKPEYAEIYDEVDRNKNTLKSELFIGCLLYTSSRALMQISALKSLQSSMQEAINSHSQNLSNLDNTTKDIILSGHSLGGHLAQIYAVTFKDSGVKELYTYNAPGIYGGILASAFTWSLRLLSFVAKAIAKGARWIARVIDKDGFIGKMVGSVFNKIKGMFGFKDDKSSVDAVSYTHLCH